MFARGARPSKVLADVQAAREKERKTKIELPAALAANKDNGMKAPGAPAGNPPPAGGAEDRARGLLAQARVALRNNDLARARTPADQARDTQVGPTRPGEDCVAAVYRD